jgi:hypothetical protein
MRSRRCEVVDLQIPDSGVRKLEAAHKARPDRTRSGSLVEAFTDMCCAVPARHLGLVRLL